MNPYTNVKKLDLNSEKTETLRSILSTVKEKLPKDMQHIYDHMLYKLDHLPGAKDRVMFSASEMDIAANALRRHEKGYGRTAPVADMLAQLTMTRKEYREYRAARASA